VGVYDEKSIWRNTTLQILSRIIVPLLIVSMALSCVTCLQSEAKDVVIPNSPAGKQFSDWLAAFNSGDLKLIRDFTASRFSKSALTNIPANERAAQDSLIFKENQGFELRRIDSATDYRIITLVQSKLLGLWFRVTTEVEQTAPHGITDLMIRVMPTPADAQPRTSLSDVERAEELRRYIEKLARADVFSGVVLLAHDGKPFFRQAYGQADLSQKTPNRVDTRFNLASMNKMFTAVALAQLAQQGKLKLEKTVGDYLRDYPNKDVAQKVTLHQLLTHTSGLGSYWNEKYRTRKDSLKKVADFLPFFAGDPLSFEPGARFQYSNSGYIVLGLIIEKVSGQDYYDYIQEHICKPAGMLNTAFYEVDEKAANLAIGYTNADENGAPFLGERRPNWAILGRRGSSAGGGYSTAEDLLKFDVALRSNKLLNSEYTKLVLEGKVQRDEATRYAYGFEERRIPGDRVVGHGGGFPGVSTQLEMYLDTGYTVVILSNVDTLGMPAVAVKVRELLAANQVAVEKAFEKKVDVGGYGLHISCSATTNKEAPTVVLESGLNQGSETWIEVQLEVAKFARVCSYDRAGLSKSDASSDKQARTSQQMVKDLHLLLDKAGVTAPFVLVGHSFGGVNVRLFASLYPKEVVGLVLVDSVHEEETEKWLAILSSDIRKQLEAAGGRELLGAEKVDLETSMKQMQAAKWRTDIPLIVLARGTASFNLDDYAPPLRPFAPKGEELRIELQKDLATRSTKGRFLFAEKSGHMIQEDEPDLVVSAIRQVIESVRPGRN
jgi:CubicO group peptidase (beta-lactamase class C family)/pimeloyl-ACP methyl ester carboxylesterase